MMRVRSLAAALMIAGAVHAQTIPVRSVKIDITTDPGLFASIRAVRHLPGGRVLVNDPSRRRLLMLNQDFKSFTVLADTAPGAPNTYGTRAGLLSYLGDSSVFIDTDALVLIVVDPSGKFGRAFALPHTRDLLDIAFSTDQTGGFDPLGRFVYRGIKPPPRTSSVNQFEENAKTALNPSYADSAPVVRVNFDTRSVDTIAMMRLPTQKIVSFSNGGRGSCMMAALNPLPTTDAWTLLPDGSVAIVRGQDYHIDWWDINGAMTSTPKMPFDWKRINLEQREALLDSLRKADAARRAAAPPPPPLAPGQTSCRAPFVTVDAADMEDYYPPIRAGQFKADREGDVWVLPSTTTLSTSGTSGLVWDVVNRKGEIVERVRLPDGRNLAGFGPNGTVYMIYAPSPQRITLERATVTR